MSTERHTRSMGITSASRRRFLRGLATGSGALILVACGAPNPAAEAPTSSAASSGSASVAATSAPAAAATSAPASAATSAPAVVSGTQNLVVMAGTNDVPDAAIAQFQAAYPNVKIERIDADNTRLNAMIAAGTPPDILERSAPSVPIMVLQNQVLDLTDRFKASEKLKLDDLGPSIAYWKFDGKKVGEGAMYGMHKDWSPDLSLFISESAFQDAGVPVPEPTKVFTYAELAELAPKLIKKSGNRIERMGFHLEQNWMGDYVLRRLLEDGESLYSVDYSKANIKDNPKAVEFLRYVYDLSKENLVWNPLNPSPSGWSGDDFVKGQLGSLNMGYWFTGSVRTAPDSPVKDKVLMLPGATWTGKRANPSLGGAGMVIPAQTKNPDAAWSFFEFYMGDEPARDRAKSGWGVPALKSLYNLLPQETAFDKQSYAVLQDEIKYAEKPIDINPYFDGKSIGGLWNEKLEPTLRGEMTFEQLVEDLDSAVNQLIADGRSAAGV